MRILHLSSEFPPQIVYGLGRYVHELAQIQAAHNHHVTVVTNSLSGKDFELESEGVKIKRVHFPPPPKAPSTSSMLLHFNLQLLERVMETREHFDVINVHDWLTLPAGFHCARLLKIPLVTTLHDIIFNKVRGREFSAEDAYVAGIENWAVHVSAKTILLSEAVRNETISHYHAPSDRLSVIPGGVNVKPVDVSNLESIQAWRSKLAPFDEELVLYVGRLDTEKGLITLFNAIMRLHNDASLDRAWKVALAGTGVLKESLESLVKEKALSGRVTFLSYVPMDELRIAYAAADLVVVPSDYEPFGLVALEAQKMGTPVIVSHTGGLKETLERTGGGLSFETGNADHLAEALHKLIMDADLRTTLGKRGQSKVRELFAWDDLERRIAKEYEAAVRAGPPENLVPPDWLPLKAETARFNERSESGPKPVSNKKPEMINELTVFWDTAFMPQLSNILEPLISSHALKALDGRINVIPVIGPNSKAPSWAEPVKADCVRYIDPSSDADLKQAIKNSAALIVDSSLAQPLLKVSLVVPSLIPTLWVGAKTDPEVGGRAVSSIPDLYTLSTKALCDNVFRRNIARQLFNPSPSVEWKTPRERTTPLVVHVLPQLVTGGAETVLLDLVKGMRSCTHAILCLGPLEGPLPDEFRSAGATITEIQTEEVDAVIEYLKSEKPDILHLHSMSYVPNWMRIHRQLTGVPIIETEHVVNIGSGHFGHVDTVVCVSHATMKVHEQYFSAWGQASSKFEVIYNGINIDDFRNLPSKKVARSQLNLPEGRPIIGRVSALARNKLPQEALHVIPHILKMVPDALVVIVGDGPQRKPAETWVKEKGLSSSILFLGERRDIPQVLRAFDVFGYYTTKDALGNVILEAIAAGLPVVTTDVEGTTEALGSAPGSAVKLGDYDAFAAAVSEWIKPKHSKKRNSYVFPKMFTRAAMIESYTNVYKQFLKPRTAANENSRTIKAKGKDLVTALMPVFNARKDWMLEALESIKSQTLQDWKLLIVDDGSEVAFYNWLSEQINSDAVLKARTKIVRLEKNGGVAEALNSGLAQCETDLVARMDADDRMLPDRLALQIAAFENLPELSVLGGWAELIDGTGAPAGGRYSYPCGHDQIVKMLGDSCAFAHPTVMYRRSAVLKSGGYRPECRHFEDYDLWVRMAAASHRFANLSTSVLEYRVHPSSISRTYQTQQGTGAAACAARARTLTKGDVRRRRPRVLFTGVYHSYGIPGRGLSIEQFFFGRALEHMIDIELHRLPADDLIREHGQERAGNLLIEKAREIKADLVFTVLGNPKLDFLGKHIQTLTEAGVLTLNWNCDDHWRLPQTSVWAEYYSHMVTTDPQALAHFREIGFEKKVILSQWACNPFDYSPGSQFKDIDVSFFGQPYGNRPAMIKALHDAGIKVMVHGAGWRDGKEVDFGQMIDTLRRSKIALNFSHATQGDRRQIKARFFEIPACGSFMVTEYADGMEGYLQRDRHFATFETEKELVSQVRHWLNEPERDSMALEASALVRSVHTYPRRLQEVFEATGLYDCK